jgi:phage terminase large subunit
MDWIIDAKRKAILSDPTRYKVVCSGRRWGKSYFSLIYLLHKPFEANERRWIVFPTYRQAKMVSWSILKDIFASKQVRINETELSITLDNGAKIELKGADKPDSLRGVSTTMVVLDEYSYMKENVWGEIIQPTLAETQGSALFVGTPTGVQNHFYDLFVKGQSNNSDYKSWQFTTIEGGFISAEEIENAKKNLDKRTFEQEYLASFLTAANRAAYNFNRDIHCKVMDKSPRLFWGVDFGVASYMTAILCCENTAGEVYVFDEIGLQNSNTFELAKLMQQKAPNLPVYPDPAGKARTSNSTKSDHMILQEAGFSVISKKANPTQKDRLNALNKMLEDATGKHRLFVNPNCKNLIRDLELCTMENGQILKTETLSHFLDAICYVMDYRYGFKGKGVSIEW